MLPSWSVYSDTITGKKTEEVQWWADKQRQVKTMFTVSNNLLLSIIGKI